MRKTFIGYADYSSLKYAKWTRNKVYFKGLVDVLRIPTICKVKKEGKVKYKITIECIK